jgi:predicted neuraminidase
MTHPALIHSEFIYERASFPSCHASTLAETPSGLMAAWFGGSDEGEPDVCIWLAHRRLTGWTTPVKVADGAPHPCWNPVLWRAPDGAVVLFYKAGPSPHAWWGMWMTTQDDGRTWTTPARLPEGILGPIKNKPVLIGDTLLCGSSEEHAGWTVHMELARDLTGLPPALRSGLSGLIWQRTAPLNRSEQFGAIQPAILHWPHGTQMLCRTRQGVVSECWSTDGGRTWGEMRATALPNPDSGIDAAMLHDGRALLIYNPLTKGRHVLHAALSEDGAQWRDALVLEDSTGEYSYPAIIQAGDGLAHVTYTWRRERIRHALIDPSRL